MVGLVIVSHSAKAAEGIRDIAVEMGNANARIIAAGGGPDGDIGTTVDHIRTAIETAAGSTESPDNEHEYEPNGDGQVVVLVDLGSAVMNAELAVEMIEDNSDEFRVRLADAPLLEGALNAAVEIGGPNATLDSVVRVAEEAREYHKLD